MQHIRHTQQISLKEIGKEGQKKLSQSSITIVGVGALGTVVADLLCRAGVGKLILIDRDVVEVSNLQRQTLFTEKDVGKQKTEAAKERLQLIDASIQIENHSINLTNENITAINSDVVIDCLDNLESKMLLNEYCKKNHIPLIHGSSVGTYGFVFVSYENCCLNCIYGSKKSGDDCSSGVLNTVASLTASIQANEAIKILIGKDPEKNLIKINLWENLFEKIKVNRNKNCKVCNGIYELLSKPPNEINTEIKYAKKKNTENFELTIKPCKTESAIRVIPKPNLSINFNKIKNNFKTGIETPNLIVVEKEGEIIVYKHGELLFKDVVDINRIENIAREIYVAGM